MPTSSRRAHPNALGCLGNHHGEGPVPRSSRRGALPVRAHAPGRRAGWRRRSGRRATTLAPPVQQADGADGNRTHDPHVATVGLSQLSYCPVVTAHLAERDGGLGINAPSRLQGNSRAAAERRVATRGRAVASGATAALARLVARRHPCRDRRGWIQSAGPIYCDSRRVATSALTAAPGEVAARTARTTPTPAAP